MINRNIAKTISETLRSFDCVTILGPRQSGKTTLARNLFPDYRYINFENPEDRLIYRQDPKLVFNAGKNLILDEIQNFPELLSYIQIYLDTGNYKIILTGSNKLDLRSGISQSLAGRTAIFRLLPLSISELHGHYSFTSVYEMMYRGFYPALYDRKQNPTRMYSSYYETYLLKDINNVVKVQDWYLFDKFIRICAGRTGQLLNFSSISNDIGVSVNTIKSWISVLQYNFLCYLLPPFYANINKRLTKSPKLYFYDTGLLSYLLGVEDYIQLETHPLRGEIYENMIINEFIKIRYNQGKDHKGAFYRDQHGVELDYVIPGIQGIDAYEIKSAFTFTESFLKNFKSVSSIEKINLTSKNIIYNGESRPGPEGLKLLNYYDLFTNNL
ncbi:MAG: ATP-binding protein [Saprospiraceae bacterium]|nr:ATP-binding protein [Saprospiraceae bacterium]